GPDHRVLPRPAPPIIELAAEILVESETAGKAFAEPFGHGPTDRFRETARRRAVADFRPIHVPALVVGDLTRLDGPGDQRFLSGALDHLTTDHTPSFGGGQGRFPGQQ